MSKDIFTKCDTDGTKVFPQQYPKAPADIKDGSYSTASIEAKNAAQADAWDHSKI